MGSTLKLENKHVLKSFKNMPHPPQWQPRVPETFDLTFVYQHQYQRANSHNQDDYDTTLVHFLTVQPTRETFYK